MKNAPQDSLKPLTPDYPFTISARFDSEGKIIGKPEYRAGDSVEVKEDGEWITFIAPFAPSCKRRLFYNGIEFPLWRWVPYRIRWLVWRYRCWRAQPMQAN